MTTTSFDRRSFLSGWTLAAAGAAGMTFAPSIAPKACAAIHKQIAEQMLTVEKKVALAGSNVVSSLLDIACPCCGQALFNFNI